MTMTKTIEAGTLAELRRRLETDHSTLIERIAAINPSSCELTATHGHGESEIAVRDVQRVVDGALKADSVAALDAVTAALSRFEDGTYGHCESCGEAIPTERLLAIPAAARCIGCQQRVQATR